MKKYFAVFCLFFGLQPTYAQDLVELRYDSVVCYASDVSTETFVPPSRDIIKRINARTETESDFIVDYGGFTDEAKAAFQYAVDIWDAVIDTPIPVRIVATWEPKSEGVLGSARWADIRMPMDAGIGNTWYPLSVAEKITGQQLNSPAAADIQTEFNSDFNWYYGLDGQAPSDTHDLVTVVLHEIGHGLGLTSSFFANTSVGVFGAGNNVEPIIYDHFVVNSVDEKLIDLYQSGTSELAVALTSNNLYFNSPIAIQNSNGSVPRLFAPNPWDGGSSISHLDEQSYPPGTINSLMTPQLGRAEVVHAPGPIVEGMLADMGWIHTYLDHDPLPNSEQVNDPIDININITSDTDLEPNSAKLFYSTDGFDQDETVVNLNDLGLGEYNYQIPAFNQEELISYYMEVTDIYGRTYREPYSGYYTFQLGADTEFPVIEHEPLPFIFNTDEFLNIAANITDNYQVTDAVLDFRLNDGPNVVENMTLGDGDEYAFPIDLTSLNFTGNDYLYYTIRAEDGSLAGNSTVFPLTGEQELRIVGIRDAVSSYFNDLEGGNGDFVGVGFDVLQPDGFNNFAIHSDHPYENDKTISYQMLVPIALSDPISMKFDEIVLVQPGEPGFQFGSSFFKDYVIVEASKDLGKTWRRLDLGYDSQDFDGWQTLFDAEITDGISTGVGDPSLYRSRIINLLGNSTFSPGEEILIRFSLYPNDTIRGWGWAIDNITINDQVLSTEDPLEEVQLFPNPSKGLLTIQTAVPLLGKLSNLQGQIVMSLNISGSETLDLEFLEKGIYLLQLEGQTKRIRKRIVLVD